jgi:hypothetical protein
MEDFSNGLSRKTIKKLLVVLRTLLKGSISMAGHKSFKIAKGMSANSDI